MKEGWEYKKLGEVCDIYQPKTISSKELVEDGKYLVYGANGVIGKYNSYNHESSEVLMTCRGATCGTINVSKPYSWINGNAMVVHPQHNILSQNFLFYLLKGLDLSDVITGAAQPQITRQSLAPKKIAIPSLSEQQHIVDELDLLSSIIEKKKAQLNELDNLAQSLFYEMFGDPITNDKGWEVRKLNDIYKLKSGDGLSAKNFVEGIYPVYGGNGISGYHNAYNMNGDFIIIGRVGAYCGNVRYVKGLFWLTDNAFQLFFDANIQTPVFVLYLLTLLDLHRFANEAAQPVISNKTLRDLDIIIPTMEMQKLFASKIETIEHQKELIRKSIKEVETLYNSRMDFWFN